MGKQLLGGLGARLVRPERPAQLEGEDLDESRVPFGRGAGGRVEEAPCPEERRAWRSPGRREGAEHGGAERAAGRGIRPASA